MEDKYYYSKLTGFGIYERLEGSMPFLNIAECVQMQQVDSKIVFYARHISDKASDAFTARMMRMIAERLPEREWIWPCDVVADEDGDTFLLFAPDAYPQYATIGAIAARKNGFEDREVLQALSWLLDRLIVLWNNGYAAAGLALDDFYYDMARGDGYITFSERTAFGIAEGEQKNSVVRSVIAQVKGHADPKGFELGKERYYWDNDSFLIAVASVVFYLMIGRMPYDGALQDDDRYDMEFNPDRFWTQCYPFRPFFIMDAEDGEKNRVGEYPEELEQIARYNRLTPRLKEMFCQSLCSKHVNREEAFRFFTPLEWKMALGEWYTAYQQVVG